MKRYVLIALIAVMAVTANATPADSLVQVLPSTIGPYCPKKLLGGDREFGGHGPEVWAWVKITVVNKINIVAEVYMHARETVSDWSETDGTWTKVLYKVPDGYEIANIVSGSYSEVHYVSKPGVNAFSPAGLVTALGGQKGVDVPFKDDGLVARWNIVGDTGGDDISTDDNPNDDTQVAIQLNPIKLNLRRLPARVIPTNKNGSATIPVLIPVDAGKVAIVSPRNESVVQHLPSTIGPYCPSKLLGGDREFGGHGPEIWAWVKLRIVNKTEVYADVYMHARETVSDWSETDGNWSKLIYTASSGYEIVEITSGMYSEVHYVSKPGVNAFSPLGLVTALGGQKGSDVPFKDDGLVSRWNIVGDTGGGDISDDNNCNDDTQVAIQLNPMKIKVRKK
jgi:hypothetical protein